MTRFGRCGAALLVLAAAAGCKKGGEAAAAGDAAAADSIPEVTAELAVAQVRAFPVTIGALGVVGAAPGHMADLAAPAPTRVLRILVAPGQRVARGQPLVELDATAWEADARKAEAARTTAQQAYDRAARLSAAGIVPRKDAEAAAAALADARAALVTAAHTRAQATLRSPIPGVVSSVSARLNGPADPAQTLVQVVDPAGLEVSLSLPPEKASGIRGGMPVRVMAGRDASGVLLGTGVVAGVGAAIDTASGSVQVRATIPHASGNLFVGQDVYAEIGIAEHPAAVTVPPEALVPEGTGLRVFVVDAKGIAHAQEVTVGARHPDAVEVTSGLKGGETVVGKGAYGVQDGARIRRGTP
ncbi:MAG TPA: efflux RND transporter periplasmic adaptor subunit [Longimicrobiaceae bacterium]|nr:efflux RND transporter periplasmic adaptor subunit [Longimicrobiaceae bacterium]